MEPSYWTTGLFWAETFSAVCAENYASLKNMFDTRKPGQVCWIFVAKDNNVLLGSIFEGPARSIYCFPNLLPGNSRALS
jgi:hypothetical protein